jgi:hypothetical protein
VRKAELSGHDGQHGAIGAVEMAHQLSFDHVAQETA